MKLCSFIWLPGLFLTLGAPAQYVDVPAIEWQNVYGGYADDFAFALVQTDDGGYLVGGSSGSPAGGNKTSRNYDSLGDYWIVRIDRAGNSLWDRSYGGSRLDQITTIQSVSTNGFLVGGFSWSSPSGNKEAEHYGSYASGDYWLVRVDENGNKLWEQNYGGTGGDNLQAILPASEDGYFLCGRAGSTVSGNKTAPKIGGIDYWIVRVDSNGIWAWDKTYGGIYDDLAWNATKTSDGGLIVGGGSISGSTGTKTTTNIGDYDFWVVRLDASGNQLWDRSYGGTNDDTLYAVREMPDGGFVMAGRSSSPPSGNKSSPNYGRADFWLVRTDSEGNKLWDQSFGGDDNEYPYALDVTDDGGIIFGGRSFSLPSGNKTSPNYGGGDYWVIRLDADGSKVWEATYGGSRTEDLGVIRQTRDGGFILGGSSWSPESGNKTVPNFFFSDYWVVKLAPEQPHLQLLMPPIGGGPPTITLAGIKNMAYEVESSDDLQSWVSLSSGIFTNRITELMDSPGQRNQRFYRARIVR